MWHGMRHAQGSMANDSLLLKEKPYGTMPPMICNKKSGGRKIDRLFHASSASKASGSTGKSLTLLARQYTVRWWRCLCSGLVCELPLSQTNHAEWIPR